MDHFEGTKILPREGHLEAFFRIYPYLKGKRNTLLLFDPGEPKIDPLQFLKRDWKYFYGDVNDELPPNMSKPLGKEVILRLYCDSDYA